MQLKINKMDIHADFFTYRGFVHSTIFLSGKTSSVSSVSRRTKIQTDDLKYLIYVRNKIAKYDIVDALKM